MTQKERQESLEKLAKLRGCSIEEALVYAEKMAKEYEEKQEKIRETGQTEYMEWLYNYVKEGIVYSTDTAFVVEDEKDKQNLAKLSLLQRHIENLAEERNIENIVDKDNEFQVLNFVFKYKDHLYRIDTMIGQGAITFIELIDNTDRAVIEL